MNNFSLAIVYPDMFMIGTASSLYPVDERSFFGLAQLSPPRAGFSC